jgi:hypothetical protein
MLLGLFTSGIQALVFATLQELILVKHLKITMRSTFKWEHMEKSFISVLTAE